VGISLRMASGTVNSTGFAGIVIMVLSTTEL